MEQVSQTDCGVSVFENNENLIGRAPEQPAVGDLVWAEWLD